MKRPSLWSVLGAGIDRAALGALGVVAARWSQPPDSAAWQARLEAVARAHPPSPWSEEAFAPVELGRARHRTAVTRFSRLRVTDLEFDSAFTPRDGSLLEPWGRHPDNAVLRLRCFRRPDSGAPGPALLIVHGFNTGRNALEERLWPFERFVEAGFTVWLYQLPFHAERGGSGRFPPFPSDDVRWTVEGMRQAIGELRSVASWLRSEGATAVSVMGMSLGGYTTALLATVEPRLDAWTGVIPLASFTLLQEDQKRMAEGESPLRSAHFAAHRPVAPLDRSPAVAPERCLVLLAQGDQVTPPRHAEALISHFGAERVECAGSHLLQRGLQPGWDRFLIKSRELGILAPRNRGAR